jgi:putative phosphoesterase
LSTPLRVGLIADTHDLLRPAAVDFLRGCDFIVHAGDICGRAVLDALEAIAPTTAVRGNNDRGAWAGALRESELVEFGGITLYAIHDVREIDIDPEAAGVRVVVSGHSHRPSSEVRGGVLFVNPGSAGPRRFALPISIAELVVESADVSVRLAELADARGPSRPG